MTQQEAAIQQVVYALKGDEAVRAVFLKGSIARGEQDEFSDVDLYCVVDRVSASAYFLYRELYAADILVRSGLCRTADRRCL